LVGFEGEAVAGKVMLHWSTGSEVDNYKFQIERSVGLQGNFEIIAEIPSSNGVGTTEYSYQDANVQAGNTYSYRITDVSIYGYPTVHSNNIVEVALAGDFALEQNHPNPFNPTTSIRFSVPTTGQTRLDVYDMSGRLVTTLVNGQMTAGSHQATWNATNMPSGMYIYRLTAGNQTASGKMMFVK
jgi:hypothetical protein